MNDTMTTQRIISFDVGIKNMAYCIFENIQKNNNENTTSLSSSIKILDWQVLNLIEREPAKKIENCQALLSKKIAKKKKDMDTQTQQQQQQQCQKPSKYRIDSVSTNSQYFCEKHAKETQYIMPKDKFSSSKLKKMDIEELNKHLQKYSLSIQQTKKSAIENLEKYIQENSLELIEVKKKSANDLDLITLGKHMMLALDQNPHIKGITHVLIENQISPIANRMKTVQGMLAQYFIMRVPECCIEFVSSSNKLKAFTNNYKKTEQKLEKNETDNDKKSEKINAEYKQHKRDGVYYCAKVLHQNTNISCWQDPFNNSKKKDDLADAFLQGLWYMIHKKWITLDIKDEIYIIK
jgi:hypothetical protein